ncbi:MAG TPA: PD-(D/E)XK nuclease family protein, partial [Xanthobacteraceae bacterium]|nr:PD-(D/E)XK nuclease family protein [Xanthobacteraceae bacterium]
GAAEALRRGALVHRLLAGLAALDGAARAGAGLRLLGIEAADWPEAARQGLLAEVLAVLELEALAPLFAPGSLAEVPLAGTLDGVAVTGRIDRLAVFDDLVLIADFKTDARPPAAGAVPAAHRDQIALYAGLVARLFPGTAVEGRLVYTAGPIVHALGAEELGDRLARLTSP